MKCKLCQREGSQASDFCGRHMVAEEALRSRYAIWRNAYEELSWTEYLRKIKQLKGTGQWVKEVIANELSEAID